MTQREVYKIEALEEMRDRIKSLQDEYTFKYDEYDYYKRHKLVEEYQEKEVVCEQMVNLIQAAIDTIKGP